MKLEQLKALEQAATPGPWKVSGGQDVRVFYAHYSHSMAHGSTKENAALIAAARNMLPKLIAVAEAAKAWAIECRYELGHDKPKLTYLFQALNELEGGE